MAEETVIQVTKSYQAGPKESLAFNVPLEVKSLLKMKKGQKFLVKIDSVGRVIYEPLIQPQHTERD